MALSQMSAALVRSENAKEGDSEAHIRYQQAGDRLINEQESVITNACLARVFAGPAAAGPA